MQSVAHDNGAIPTIQNWMQMLLNKFITSKSLQVSPLLLGLLREVVVTQLVDQAEGHAGML